MMKSNLVFKVPRNVAWLLKLFERIVTESWPRLVSFERRVGARLRVLGHGLHPDVEVDGDGVFADLNEAGVDDLAVDLHHGHVVGGI